MRSEVEELVAEYKAAKTRRERGAVVKKYAERFGVTRKTIYAWLRERIGARRVVRRAGRRKWDESVLAKIIAIKDEYDVSLRVAVGIARDLGWVQEGDPYWAAWDYMKKYEKAKNSTTRMIITKYPNQLHQTDATKLEEFEVFERDGELWVRYVGYYRRKRADYKTIWAFLLIDDYSRFVYGDIIYTAGESSAVYIDFLLRAWASKDREDDFYPFAGVPEILMVDRAPGLVSSAFRAFLESIRWDGGGIAQWVAVKPNTKGKVERKFRQIEDQFFKRFWKTGFEMRLEEFQAHFHRYLSHLNNFTVHPVDSEKTPVEKWMEIVKMGGVRALPEAPEALLRKIVVHRQKIRFDSTFGYGDKVYVTPLHLVGKHGEIWTMGDGKIYAFYEGKLYGVVEADKFIDKGLRTKVREAKRIVRKIGPVSPEFESDKVLFIPPPEEVVEFADVFGFQTDFESVLEVKEYIVSELGIPIKDLDDVGRRWLDNFLSDRQNWVKGKIEKFVYRLMNRLNQAKKGDLTWSRQKT